MRLEKNTMYNVKIRKMSFGAIGKKRLEQIISSGRICGVLLEADIASRFEGVEDGTQGEAPDLIDKRLGTIQAKTFRSSSFRGCTSRGKNAGCEKKHKKAIFTTKSGLWDSMKRRRQLGEDVDKQIVEYFDKYDCFCYIDISRMKNLEYSFIIVSSSVPKKNHVEGSISLNDILKCVKKEVNIEG